MAQASAARQKLIEQGIDPSPKPSVSLEEQRLSASIRRSALLGLPRERWNDTFESFHLTPGTQEAFDAVQAFLQERPARPGLLLWGSPGTGKTHLAYAAVNYCRERGWPFMFRRVPDVMKECRDAIKAEKRGELTSADDVVRTYAQAMFLVLDDLGAHQDTEYASAVLYDIIDARYRKHVPTIVTSNHAPDRIDERIASRLHAYRCVGQDMRGML